ncbi:MAG: nucleotidyltransferase [Flavobacterium sp.]|nr:MAG: nucleotidyltransferase [Flavobacterium sp.]
MARFSEDMLNNWRMPPSDAEETKLSNAQRLVNEAIAASSTLKNMSIRVFGQGSYANDTNVRLNSDVDINVQYSHTFFSQLPPGKQDSDFGLISSDYTFGEFKNTVEAALVAKFGRADIVRHDKCITVLASNNRVEADVVPTFQHRRYVMDGSYTIGTEFISDSGATVINFPEQHIANGKVKNGNTQKRFKRLTRIYRRIRYRMIDEKIGISKNITSFLLECLVWNVPNHILNDNHSWTDRTRESINYLYHATKDNSSCAEWGEVSELLYLFKGGRKWSREEVNNYLQQMWNYLEF